MSQSIYFAVSLSLMLSACAPATAPAPAATAPASGNPLENTVLDAQGKALQQARDVQKQVEAQAAAQRKAIDEAEGQ